MKIDFQQNFGVVSRLISTRAKSAYETGQKIAANSQQPIDFKAQLGSAELLKRSLEMPPPPPLVAPEFAPPAASSLAVKPGLIGVKTPTIVSVDRIALADDQVPQGTVAAPTAIALQRISSDDPSARASLAPVRSPARAAQQFTELITTEGVRTGIDPALGIAVATAESSMDPDAVSSDGHASKGLFQLLDRTGAELHAQAGGEPDGYNPFEPEQNVRLGMRYLRKLHEYFSEPTDITGVGTTVPAANSASLEKLAVAAFNAGEGRVTSAQTRAAKLGFDPSIYDQVSSFLPDSTQGYVTKVISIKEQVGGAGRTDDEIT